MTEAEAHRVLGLCPPASKEEVRAAYLARLRTTRPDQDPEAFKTLRAAYERLHEPERTDVGSPWFSADEPSRAPLRERLDELGGEPSMERARLIEQELHQSPGSPDLLRLLFAEVLAVAGPSAIALDVLEELAEVDPEHVWHLKLAHYPACMGAAALAAPPDDASTRERVQAVRLLIHDKQDQGRASKALRAVIEAASPEELAVEAEELAELALDIMVWGFASKGQPLLRALLDRSAADNPASKRFTGIDELASADPDLPRRLLVSLAGAIRYDRAEWLLDYAEEADCRPSDVRRMLVALPVATERFGGVLVDPEPAPQAEDQTVGGWLWRGLLRTFHGPEEEQT